MCRKLLLQTHHEKLNLRYRELAEQAYNFRQTDHALSDYSEFKAMKILYKINQIKYLSRVTSETTS